LEDAFAVGAELVPNGIGDVKSIPLRLRETNPRGLFVSSQLLEKDGGGIASPRDSVGPTVLG